MKDTLNNVLIFAVGAAIGSAVTWYFVKTKYERIAQEEIDSVKEEFSKHKLDLFYDGPQDADEAAEKDDIQEEVPFEEEFAGMIQKLGYHNYSDVEPTHIDTKKKDIPEESASRVITPEEFGEEGYKIVELTYWADGVLTDNKNKRIQDVDALLGKGNIERFGEHEPDALHVRNDEKKLDFEIVRDLKRYSEIFDEDGPHSAED